MFAPHCINHCQTFSTPILSGNINKTTESTIVTRKSGPEPHEHVLEGPGQYHCVVECYHTWDSQHAIAKTSQARYKPSIQFCEASASKLTTLGWAAEFSIF